MIKPINTPPYYEFVDGGTGILQWTGLLTQVAAGDPTAVVNTNTLSGPIVWTRTGQGDYIGTLTGAFGVKTEVYIGPSGAAFYYALRSNSNIIAVSTRLDGGAASDNLLAATALTIKVYQ